MKVVSDSLSNPIKQKPNVSINMHFLSLLTPLSLSLTHTPPTMHIHIASLLSDVSSSIISHWLYVQAFG